MNPEVEDRVRMARVLFWLFVTVFAITAVFAFIALGMVLFDPERVETYSQLQKFTWALWVTIVVEVAAMLIALGRNLFGLSSESEISTAKNQVGELIDGLESDGDISKEKADLLRKEYSDSLGSTAKRPVRKDGEKTSGDEAEDALEEVGKAEEEAAEDGKQEVAKPKQRE